MLLTCQFAQGFYERIEFGGGRVDVGRYADTPHCSVVDGDGKNFVGTEQTFGQISRSHADNTNVGNGTRTDRIGGGVQHDARMLPNLVGPVPL